jgi:hypothetical protein
MSSVSNGDLLERAATLKGQLVTFAERTPRVSKHLGAELARQFGDTMITDESRLINAIDHFVLQHRLPDGRSVVEHFVGSHRELTDTDCEILLGWHDVVDGVFQVDTNDDGRVDAVNVIDELPYQIRANAGPAVLSRLRPGDFLVGRIVPLDDGWMLSGAQGIFPATDKPHLLRTAAAAAMAHPELVLRNPAKVARAWEIQRRERDCFVEFFGADLVVIPGPHLQDRWDEFWDWRLAKFPSPSTALADNEQVQLGPTARLDLPDDLTGAATVAAIYDEAEGLIFLTDFGSVEAAFDHPDLAYDDKHRQTVLGYLKDDSVSALPFRRLAARDPDRASLLFARLLKKPRFVWARDGEALLRRYKPDSSVQQRCPTITVLSDALAQALQVA